VLCSNQPGRPGQYITLKASVYASSVVSNRVLLTPDNFFKILALNKTRLVVGLLESGLGLESGLKSFFAGLGLGLGGSASKSFFQVFFVPTKPIAL